jgi:hypothetical protein
MEINYKNILIGVGSGLLAGFLAFRKGLEIGGKWGYDKAMSDATRPMSVDSLHGTKNVNYI